MEYAEAAQLKIGDTVTITYLGKPEPVVIISTIHGDRWNRQMVVQFQDGSTVAVDHETMTAGFHA